MSADGSGRAEAIQPASRKPRQKILLIDDDPIQLKVSRAFLLDAGFEVETAVGGAEGLQAARRNRPDAILSDVIMHGLDGFALCHTVRTDPRMAGIPVVLISAALHAEDDRTLARSFGASELVERSPDFTRELAALMRGFAADAPALPDATDPAMRQLYFEKVAGQLGRLLDKSRAAEARYRTLFENAGDAIGVLTTDGVIVEANLRCAALFQYTPEQMKGRHIRDFAASGHAQENVDRFQRDVRSGNEKARAYALNRADGKTIYVEFTNAGIESEGQPRVLSIGRDVTESFESERKLEASEHKYRTLIENIPEVIWSATRAGNTTFVSSKVTATCGFTPDEFMADRDLRMGRVAPDDASLVREAYRALLAGEKALDIEYRWQHKDGHWIWLQDRAAIASSQDGAADHVEGVFSDVSARKVLEEQLRQSQKMEAVGQLTGGVAHDFNNILAVILANSEFLVADLAEHDPRRADALEIKQAAERAAALTRQLLAFSRRQVLEPTVLNLDEVTTGLERMLRRVIGEDIDLEVLPTLGLGSVRADPGQIEQVLMNLVVNARDAMPNGGKLSIETANVDLDDEYVPKHRGAKPGRYVMLAVSDTGSGMDAATQQRIFEPFFTTKEKGRGTGLGLSTCYGIVKQSDGYIWVYSEPGHGTVFKIYLPRVDDMAEPSVEKPETVLAGSETILMLEDDSQVRSVVLRILKAQGYRVLAASNAQEALALLAAHQGPIDLILSDVIIPGVSGIDVVSQVRQVAPDIKVLFMSGYTDHALLRDGMRQGGTDFIQKPFAPQALAKKVREVLDA